MKTTNFEQAIALGIANFITLLEKILDVGAKDPNVSAEIFIPAAVLKNEIHDSVEKYSERMLKIHSIKD